MITRDLKAARAAFEDNDPEQSKKAHNAPPVCREPGHVKMNSGLRKAFVFGGFEGIMVSTVIIAAASSVTDSTQSILSIALGSLFAVAIALGLRDYININSEISHYERERKREQWELSNFPDGEKLEMIELYMSKGMSHEEASTVIGILSKYEPFFVDIMMEQELQLMKPDSSPLYCALATSASYLTLGSIPILVYVLATNQFALGASSSSYISHPAAVGLVTALVATMAESVAQLKFVPERARLSMHLGTFATSLVVVIVALGVTSWLQAHL